jgi:hypothetical protein
LWDTCWPAWTRTAQARTSSFSPPNRKGRRMRLLYPYRGSFLFHLLFLYFWDEPIPGIREPLAKYT